MSKAAASGEAQMFPSAAGGFLKGLGTSLRKYLLMSLADERIYPGKSIALSLDRGRLSIAYGSRVLSAVSVKAARDYSFDSDRYPQPNEVLSSLSLFVKEHRLLNIPVTVMLPKAWIVMKTAEFPATVLENTADVISYEMDRLTPFSRENAWYDYQLLQDDGSRITVLIIAVRQETVEPYTEALAEGGFVVRAVTANSSGMGNFSRYVSRKDDLLFLDVREKYFESTLFVRGLLFRSLSNRFSSDDAADRAEVISRDIRSLAVGPGYQPGITVLSGEGVRTLKEALRHRLPGPVTILSEAVAGSAFPLLKQGISYAAAGGVIESLWPNAQRTNLLSRGGRQAEKPPLLLTGVLAAALVVLAAVSVISPLRFEEKRLQELTRQIEARKEEARKVEGLKSEAEALRTEIAGIHSFKGSRPMALAIVKELTSVLPDTVWLTRVRITETGVDIEGYAQSSSGLLSKLETSRLLKKAEFASSTVRDARLNAERFVIKTEIEGTLPVPDEKVKNEKK